MSTAENVAVGRRIQALEETIEDTDLILVRTTIVKVARGPEPKLRTASDVYKYAGRDPSAVEVERIPDLELLIDPVNQIRKLRSDLSPRDQAEFDDLKNGDNVKIVDVEIQAHEKQIPLILSEAPITACFGGNRAGKTIFLMWWLFRRWMRRGGPGRTFWWVGPVMKRSIEYGAWGLAGPSAMGGGLWPDAVFAGTRRIPKSAQSAELVMIDGSRIAFQHAATSGVQAGANLKSANVTDAVIDELGTIRAVESWHQVLVRVSQKGGLVATGTTRVRGHWSDQEIEGQVETQGEGVFVSKMTLFDNPWLPLANTIRTLFQWEAITPAQFDTHIAHLESVDEIAEACKALVTNPNSLRDHFGEATEDGNMLWPGWNSDLILKAPVGATVWVTGKDNKAKQLHNITAYYFRGKWNNKFPSAKSWQGMDFNAIAHSTQLQLFGEGRTPEEAFANKDSWTLIVAAECETKGTTLAHVQETRKRWGVVPIYGDPTGAMNGANIRGTEGTTDIQYLQGQGVEIRSAVTAIKGKPQHLSFSTSRNLINEMIEDRKFFVHESCTGLIDAMRNDKADRYGGRSKVYGKNSESDIRSGYSDATRYGLWPVFKFLLEVNKPKVQYGREVLTNAYNR